MHRLLNYAIPRPTKPLPQVWLVEHRMSNRDEVQLGIVGFSCDTFVVPREVQDAYAEYWENMRRWHIRSEPTWQDKTDVLLGIWLLHLREIEYIPFEPVATHPATK